MKKRRFLHSRCFLLAVCAAFVLTGCSMGKKQENIDQGMEAIAQLDYEGALACFEKALVEGEDEELLYQPSDKRRFSRTRARAARVVAIQSTPVWLLKRRSSWAI